MLASRIAVGLDIGRHSAKIVRAERRWGKVAFTRADVLKLPRGGAETVTILRRWLESLNLLGCPCVVGISGRAVILKFLELTPDDPRTLRQVTDMEMRKFRELTSEELVFDTLPLRSEGRVRRACLVVARPEALDPVLRTPTEAGLTIADVTPIPAALFNALAATSLKAGAPTLCVDLGYRGTEVAVGDRSGLHFLRQFEIGIAAFSETLARVRGVSVAQAEEQISAGEVNLAELSPAEAVDAWIAELSATLSLYRERFPQAPGVQRLVLVGGGAVLTALAAHAAERLGLEVREPRGLPVPAGTTLTPGQFAVAAGLALRGVEADTTPISLLPSGLRRALAVKRDRRYWAATAAVLAALVVVGVYGHHRDTLRRRQAEAVAAAARARVEAVQQELAATLARNRELVTMLTDVHRLAVNRLVLLDVLSALAEAKPPSDWIVEVADASFYTNTPYVAVLRPGTNRPTASVTATASPEIGEAIPFRDFFIKGFTAEPTFYLVRSMLTQLQRDPRTDFAQLLEELPVDDKTPRDTRWDALGGVPFTIHIRARGRPLGEATNLPPSSVAAVPQIEFARRSLEREQRRAADLAQRWQDARQRLSTFKSLAQVFDIPDEEEAGLIDFRVALMETRRKLTEQAAVRGTDLPSDLGLKEAAERDKNVRQLLFELATIRKLAEIAVDLSVAEIGEIEPLAPVLHQLPGATPYLEEYPIRIKLKCSYPALIAMLDQLGRETHFVALKQLRMKKAALEPPDLVDATLVVAAVVFPQDSEARPPKNE